MSLILCVVSNFYVVPEFHFTLIFQFAHNDPGQRGFSFAVFANKSYFFAAFNGQINFFQNIELSVVFGQFPHFGNHCSGAQSRRKFNAQSRIIFIVNFKSFKPIQCFHTRLYLNCFGSLIAETGNKFFCISNHFLLIDIGCHLSFLQLFAENQVFGIIRFEIVNTSEGDFDGSVGNRIKESPVVRNQYNCSVVCSQKIF